MYHESEPHYSTADKTFTDLCNEVDYWKEKYTAMKQRYDELNKEHNQSIDANLKSTKETIGQIFKIVLNSEQREDGILIKQTNG